MLSLSSPITYLPSSSPPQPQESRKRSLANISSYPVKRQSLGSNDIDTGNPQVVRQNAAPYLLINYENHTTKSLGRKGPFIDEDDEEDQQTLNGNGIRAPFVAEEEPIVRDIESIVDNARNPTKGAFIQATTSAGKTFSIRGKERAKPISFEKLIAERSTTASGRATKSFYGVDIHALLDQAAKEKRQNVKKFAGELPDPAMQISNVDPSLSKGARKRSNLLWTERYRAHKFTDLVGDERTHRDVLWWIKQWDPIVFPGAAKPRPKKSFSSDEREEKQHRKLLLLTGPPGLGKTTLAHVCARQAGYEVVEINASDDRTSQVVKGRIRDCVGTENVRGSHTNTGQGKVRKAGRPVCVIVDEVDGVASGTSNSGEGGFIKALVDLVALDQKNSNGLTSRSRNLVKSGERDKFRLLRPIILICNDIYHPSLRPLRTSSIAEIIHLRKPPLDKVIARLKFVFEKEGIAYDGDGVRKLCEATWGIAGKKEAHFRPSGEGDMRSILVVGEWAAGKLRASSKAPVRLSRKWVEDHITEELSHGGQGSRGVGRGGAKEAVTRVFTNKAGFINAAFPAPMQDPPNVGVDSAVGVAEASKRSATDQLREIIDASGESDRIMTDCFTTYPTHPFHDNTFLSKPNAACDWLHFHDLLSSKVYEGQGWELGSYLSHSILGFHHLFASSTRQGWSNQRRWDEDADGEPTQFSGPKADYEASEMLKQNKAIFQGLYSSLSIPLIRSFRSEEDLATDLLPHLLKVLAPNVKPIVVGGSGDQAGMVSVRKEGERQMIERAVVAMDAVGVVFERARVESGRTGVSSSYIYRMQP